MDPIPAADNRSISDEACAGCKAACGAAENEDVSREAGDNPAGDEAGRAGTAGAAAGFSWASVEIVYFVM